MTEFFIFLGLSHMHSCQIVKGKRGGSSLRYFDQHQKTKCGVFFLQRFLKQSMEIAQYEGMSRLFSGIVGQSLSQHISC